MELELPDELPRSPKVFKPLALYSTVGDVLQVYLEDEPAYAQQVSPEITVLRAFSDGRIVGVKVSYVAAKVNH